MALYRKKPVVIEAIQWNTEENINAAIKMLGDKLITEEKDGCAVVGYWVATLEGNMMISFGDFIIKGVQGEFYPYKPDIFEKTYEKIDDFSLEDNKKIKDLVEFVNDCKKEDI